MQSISNRHIVLDQFGLTVELADDKGTLRVTPSRRITPVARDYIQANKEALRNRLLGTATLSTFTSVGDLTAGVVTALATGQPTPAPPLPTDLLERVNLICQLERWAEADREEWLTLLRRQIDRDRVPVHELVACLDAHLARHHGPTDPGHDREAFEERAAILEYDGGLPRAEAERLAGQVHLQPPR